MTIGNKQRLCHIVQFKISKTMYLLDIIRRSTEQRGNNFKLKRE